MDGRTDGWIDGWIERQTDRDLQTAHSQVTSPWFSNLFEWDLCLYDLTGRPQSWRIFSLVLAPISPCFDRAMRFWPLHIIPYQFRLMCPLGLKKSPAMNWGPTWSFLRCATYGPRVGHWDGSQGSWSQKNFEIFEPLELVKMVVETSEMYQVGGLNNLEMECYTRAEEVHWQIVSININQPFFFHQLPF